MGDENEFLQYLRLQDEPALLTKSELLEFVRARGASISDRQLTSYITEGLMPKSVRIGSRAGAYPQIVGSLLVWIIGCRRRGLSVEAIRELIPLWRFVQRQLMDGVLDLKALEELARDQVTLPEAVFAIPSLLVNCLVCPTCGNPSSVEGLKVVMKNGDTQLHDADHPVTLGFLVADQDDEGNVRRMASMSTVLPVMNRGDEPATVVLGIPNDVDLPPLSPACEIEGLPPGREAEGVEPTERR